MENQKNNKGVIALLIVIIVILSALCVLFATGTISFKSNDVANNETNENINDDNNVENNDENNSIINDTKEETTDKYFYDVKDLNVKALPEYQVFGDISKNKNVVETVDFGFEKDYSAYLDLSGNVTVQKYSKSENEKGITGNLNVNGIIDVVHFSVPATEAEQLLYLLTDNGDVYYYRIGDIENNSFNATKVESVSNVKKIFISNFSKANAGGSWALFAITSGNDCIMIKGESV